MVRKVILLFGGESQERLVSVATAQNLSRYVPDVKCWYWSPDEDIYEISAEELQAHQDPFNSELIPSTKPLYTGLELALDQENYRDHVFLLGIHGGRGEDGTIQQWFEDRNLHFTGSGAKACRTTFDKVLAKEIVENYGIKVTQSYSIQGASNESEKLLTELLDQHHKIVVKPVKDGSSVGLVIIDNSNGVSEALDVLNNLGEKVFIVEPFVEGTELTVGVVDEGGYHRALPCTEIRAEAGRVFDYKGKYLGEGVKEITPADVNEDLSLKAQEAARICHKVLGCYGYSRSDFIMNNNEAVYLETNTLPGLTAASLVPQQLEAYKMTMSTFVENILKLAETRYDTQPL